MVLLKSFKPGETNFSIHSKHSAINAMYMMSTQLALLCKQTKKKGIEWIWIPKEFQNSFPSPPVSNVFVEIQSFCLLEKRPKSTSVAQSKFAILCVFFSSEWVNEVAETLYLIYSIA